MVEPCARRSAPLLRTAFLIGLSSFAASEARPDWRDDVGYTALAEFLGADMPDGAGVPISLVEAPVGEDPDTAPYFPVESDYNPNLPHDPLSTDDSLFGSVTDPAGVGVTFIDGSAKIANGVSGHARLQARILASNTPGDSISTGISEVTVFEANHFLNSVLNASNSAAPASLNFRVQNHSWIGSFGDTVDQEHATNVKALRKFDYALDTANGGEGLLAVVGVNNAAPLPYLLAHSYNGLAVGTSDGGHSSGLTLTDDPAISGDQSYGPGRQKPDLVGPKPKIPENLTTSVATSGVSSIAAVIFESATAPNANRAEVVKAQLLAGATKDEAEFTGWSRTPDQPLDPVYGAGEVNIFNTYKVQQSGQFAGQSVQPTDSVASYGWDYQTLDPSDELYYNFTVDAGASATELSVALTWFAEVTDVNSGLPALANFDMRLYDSTSSFLEVQLDESVSEVGNIEHLYLTDLAPGDYTLALSTDAARDFGLAWRMETLFDSPSVDFNNDQVIDGSDFLIAQRNLGTLFGATHADGDGDGDGDVDADDLGLFGSAFGQLTVVVEEPLLFASVPEPDAALIALTLLTLLPRRGRRRAPAG